ncbi:MAG: histidine transporter [Betaproteobacteria bacterium HGW-Betaproteobacteria-16]|nr:MAG: histidine transporter [Betaproteobacteria bacterium HGW-Betaproteobacteria-16]
MKDLSLETSTTRSPRALSLLKLLLLSSVGVFLFFVQVDLGGRSTILVDHLSGYLVREQRTLAVVFIVALMVYGALRPLLDGSWRRSWGVALFTAIKWLGLGLAGIHLANLTPEWANQKDMLPFLFERLALSVGVLIPIGALALTFLLGFGLLEIIGVLLQRVMRPLFRTPGHSALDAVASFVGSYSVGLLVTSKMYAQGKYSVRDAAIIATGFSTVSATFMVVVARTLGLMEHWTFYFWATLLVTFAVTAITAYMPPIAGIAHRDAAPEPADGQGRLARALDAGVARYESRESLTTMLWNNLLDGLRMSATVVSSILAVGFIGICLAKFTPVFEWIGLLLKPALMLADAMLGTTGASASSGAFASGLAEMFLPAILLKDAEFAVRMLAAIVSVSMVLFLSGCIPCILATGIPLRFSHLLIVWLLRTVLSIVLGAAVIALALSAGWLPTP